MSNPSGELADHFESLSASSSSSPKIRKSHRIASRSSSGYSTPIKRSLKHKSAIAPSQKRRKRLQVGSKNNKKGKKTLGDNRGRRKVGNIYEDKPMDRISGSLPGREQEYELLREKITDALRTQQGCCIYVSGVPGTGKTATVKQTVYSLRGILSRDKKLTFEFFELNGMKFTDASQIYSVLWQKISGRIVASGMALKKLNKYFERSKKQVPTIVLLDELDLLLKKRSTMLYHFFEWTGWSSSKLIVIAIANTMDLPERFLPNRIASRMGTNRINFKPYSYPQLMAIISHWFTSWKHLFHPDALEYCARKVSSVSGDARRALALAQRSIDWIKRKPDLLGPSRLITIPIMDQAIQMTFVGNPVQLMSDLSTHQKALLLALLLSSRIAGTTFVRFEKVCENHWQLLRTNGFSAISFGGLQVIFSDLELLKLVARSGGSKSLIVASSMVRLNIPEEEVSLALTSIAAFQKHLQL